MKTIRQIKNLRGKRVLVRAALNLPVLDGQVVNDFRIRKSLPTLRYLKEQGARTILIAHIANDAGGTLKPIADKLREHFDVTFVEDFFGNEGKDAVAGMNEGEIVLFENLRTEGGEIENNADFAQKLANYGDIYVNEAFSVCHREHASIMSIPKLLPTYSGTQFESEVRHLSLALNPPRPFLFAIGGIKFKTKLPLVRKFLDIADTVFVGGALANAFFEAKGYSMKASSTPGKSYNLEELVDNKKLILPIDVCGEGFSKKPEDVTDEEAILDAGPESIEHLRGLISNAAFVLWNGPIGEYKKGFDTRNNELAKMIAESDAQSVIGGGDTIASIQHLGLEDRFTFVSTAGGAMIQFLSDGTLPGIEAIKNSQEQFSL